MSINPKKKVMSYCLGENEVNLYMIEGGWEVQEIRNQRTYSQIFSTQHEFTLEDVMFLYNKKVDQVKEATNVSVFNKED